MGGRLASRYCALVFDDLNLTPIGAKETYYQYIQMHGSFPLPESRLTVSSGSRIDEFALGEDYLLYKFGDQTFLPSKTELVFVGYGIIAPEFDYNDYQTVDVSGKIVVALEGEPISSDMDYFDGPYPSVYGFPESKQRMALLRGASGFLLLPRNDVDSAYWERLRREFATENVTLAYSPSSFFSAIINPKKTDIIFDNSGFSYEEINRLHKSSNLTSFPLASKASFAGEFREREFVDANVLGMIEGSDEKQKDRYVVVSAHYDHLGIGPPIIGDSIYNGALDNALGVSALLEIARLFAELETPPKRSIIFALLAGEEKGLLGSTYYTDHPPVPIHKTVANVNIDGVAFIDDFSAVVGIGAEYSNLGDFLAESAKHCGVDVLDSVPEFQYSEAFNRSDQMAFAKAGIPSILVVDAPEYKNIDRAAGLKIHLDYMKNRYHTPFDDLNQTIDYAAAKKHASILFEFCRTIADSEKAPKWNEGSPFLNAHLRAKAEGR